MRLRLQTEPGIAEVEPFEFSNTDLSMKPGDPMPRLYPTLNREQIAFTYERRTLSELWRHLSNTRFFRPGGGDRQMSLVRRIAGYVAFARPLAAARRIA